MTAISFKPGWIAIDGVDCVGKTSMMGALATELRRAGRDVTVLPEFSDGELGDLLKANVSRNQFLSLDHKGGCYLADSLALLADMCFAVETVGIPAIREGHLVLSDRGPLSLVAYQSCRLGERGRFAQGQVALLVKHSLMRLAVPSHIVLTAHLAVLERRSRQRDRSRWTPDQRRLLASAQSRMLALGTSLQFGPLVGTVDVSASPTTDALVESIVGTMVRQHGVMA